MDAVGGHLTTAVQGENVLLSAINARYGTRWRIWHRVLWHARRRDDFEQKFLGTAALYAVHEPDLPSLWARLEVEDDPPPGGDAGDAAAGNRTPARPPVICVHADPGDWAGGLR